MFDEGGCVDGWWWSEGSGRAQALVFVVTRSLLSSPFFAVVCGRCCRIVVSCDQESGLCVCLFLSPFFTPKNC